MRKILTYITILLITLSSCTEKLDTDYKGNSDNLLVVSGEFSTDTIAHQVILSRTIDFNATEEKMESGAVVTITDLTTNEVIPLSEKQKGIYLTDSDVFGEVEHSYRLDIKTSDGESYFAESKIHPLTDIDSIEVQLKYEDFFEEYNYYVYFFGYEPEGKGNHYKWNLYMNDTLYNDTLSKSTFSSDEMVDGNYIFNFDIYVLEPDEVKSDTTVYIVEMESIAEDYYDYLNEVMQETEWRGGPYDSTPANVSTNIKGGKAKGFFKTCVKKRKSTTYIKTKEDKKNELQNN